MPTRNYKKPVIFAIIALIVAIVFAFAFKYFKKATQASKISIGDITPDYSAFNNLKLSNIINGVTLPIKVGIRNFSPEQFSLSQIKIDIYSKEKPDFLKPFFESTVIQRLSGISQHCGNDYTNFFDFRFKISRLDHSL